MRAAKALLILLLATLLIWHVRIIRGESNRRGRTTISTAEKLRSVVHDVMLRDRSLDHALTLTYAIDLRTPTEIALAPEIKITGGPVAVDVLDRPVPLTVRHEFDRTHIAFDPPPPAFGAARQITIAFTTDAPPLKYGWGYRARPLPWATTLAPPRVHSMIQAHLQELVSASGWGCTYGGSGRICALSLGGRRRSVAVPMEPARDAPFRLVFAGVLGTAISFVMWAIYRRWSKHADAMGMRDNEPIPTTEEFIEELIEERRRNPPPKHTEEIDPFDAVALVARGITGVLGLIGSTFLVSHFEGGFFPIMAPLALSVWAALAGVTITLAIGIDRPRPWISLAIIVVLATAASIPAMRWMLPGIPPVLAAVLMQLTAKA